MSVVVCIHHTKSTCRCVLYLQNMFENSQSKAKHAIPMESLTFPTTLPNTISKIRVVWHQQHFVRGLSIL